MRFIIDALSNVVTVIKIDEPGAELIFTFKMRGIHYGVAEAEAFPVEARAESVPVQYTPDEWNDLIGYLRPHAEDADGTVASWAKAFAVAEQKHATTSSGGCSIPSARRSATRPARPKGPSRRAIRCDRSRAPAATMPG